MKTVDRIPKSWLQKTLEENPEVRAAFVDEAVALYKLGDIDQDSFLALIKTALDAKEEAEREDD